MNTYDSNQRCPASVPETISLSTALATTYPKLLGGILSVRVACRSPLSSMDLQFPLMQQDINDISNTPTIKNTSWHIK